MYELKIVKLSNCLWFGSKSHYFKIILVHIKDIPIHFTWFLWRNLSLTWFLSHIFLLFCSFILLFGFGQILFCYGYHVIVLFYHSLTSQNRSILSFQDKEDLVNFKTVFFYCLLIILLPIATFFLTKTFVFDAFLQLDSIKSNICSAVAAVLALHFALGLYIYRAYSDNKVKKEIQQKLE